MNIIVIEGPEQATQAGTWAKQNSKHTWGIEPHGSLFSNHYAFNFADEQDATMFALRWLS